MANANAHLCFFLLILFGFVGISWYINYESILEAILDQIKLFLMLSPLLLLLLIHLIDYSSSFFFFIPQLLEQPAGTPWGVGLLLVLLFFMISYQSDFRERCFPLLT